MDGLEFTRAVMTKYPRPILVVSVSVEPDSPNVFRLLEAGAVDVLPKPRDILDADQDKLASELASKIRILAGVQVFRRAGACARAPAACRHRPSRCRTACTRCASWRSALPPAARRPCAKFSPTCRPTSRLPVVCVQHIGGGFLAGMVAWLAEVSPLPVRKAAQGEMPQAWSSVFRARGRPSGIRRRRALRAFPMRRPATATGPR